MAEKETGNNEDLMVEFAEFLESKRAKEQEETAAEDFDVEIWGPDGSGVRTKRSHAKPFLQKLGIDVDDPKSGSGNESGDESGTKKTNSRKTTTAKSGPESTVRKYFTTKGK